MARRNVYCLVLAALLAFAPSCVAPGGESETSVEQDISAPTLTVTSVGAANISLAWNGVTGAVKYYVFRGTAPGTEGYITTALSTSYNDGHLASGQQYCYFIKAVDNTGLASVASNEVCATTTGAPQPPTGVTATPISTTRIQVDWNAVTGAIKYYVYMSTNGGAYAYLNTTTTNQLIAANLSQNTNYCFEVAVVTSNGTSANSTPACSSTLTGGLEGYWKVNEKTGTLARDSSGLSRNGTLVGSVTYSTTDKPPVADDPSSVQFAGGAGDAITVPSVVAFNNQGPFTVAFWTKINSAGTGTINFFGKRAASCGAISWQVSQNAASGLFVQNASTTLRFGRSIPTGTWTHVAVSGTGGNGNQTRLYINGTLVASGAFAASAGNTAPLQIGNSGGCGSGGASFMMDEVQIYSAALTDAQIADLGKVPDPPANFMGTSPGQTSVSLSWSSVTNAQKYFVWRGTSSMTESFLATVFSPTTTYNDGHLTANTTYYYYMTVQAHGLLSTATPEIAVTTQPLPPPPTGVTATAISSSQINLAWNASSGATKYYVYQSINGGAYAFRATVFAPTVTYSAGGLTTGTPYCYEVEVETSPGIVSGPSTPACATTP